MHDLTHPDHNAGNIIYCAPSALRQNGAHLSQTGQKGDKRRPHVLVHTTCEGMQLLLPASTLNHADDAHAVHLDYRQKQGENWWRDGSSYLNLRRYTIVSRRALVCAFRRGLCMSRRAIGVCGVLATPMWTVRKRF